jgi:crotonobetainyl-CoA:carnitine CoA-transferase CaiB-like acyl-CoA transferase
MGAWRELSGPLSGHEAIELTRTMAGSAAGAMLGDWGAGVIKVEPLEGDPYRRQPMGPIVALDPGQVTPAFVQDNRSKRGVAIDYGSSEGRMLCAELCAQSDILLTDLPMTELEQLGLGYQELSQRYPRMVYCHISGFGLNGAEAGRENSEVGAFWARSGAGDTVMLTGREPVFRAVGMGAHQTALSAVTAICAALVARATTGRGQLVSTSLLRNGAHFISQQLNAALHQQTWIPVNSHHAYANPLNTCYRDSEGRWFFLLGLQESDGFWRGLTRIVGRPELYADPRFDTFSNRIKHSLELIEILDQEFAKRPAAYWYQQFEQDRDNVWWDPVQSAEEVARDPQSAPAGMFAETPTPQGPRRVVAPPIDFIGTPWQVQRGYPQLGEHTDEVLTEMGKTPQQIANLRNRRIIR